MLMRRKALEKYSKEGEKDYSFLSVGLIAPHEPVEGSMT